MKGLITIRFDSRQSEIVSKYEQLLFCLKSNLRSPTTSIRGVGGDAFWQQKQGGLDIERKRLPVSSARDAKSAKAAPRMKPSSKRKAPADEDADAVEDVQPSILEILLHGEAKKSVAKTRGGRDASASLPLAVRRSARHSAADEGSKRESPSGDPDEIILVYPPATTGAVTIQTSDLNRLQPGEYLNDTLTEFGLKVWLKELEIQRPDFAKSIHVFSSFFYKKLNKKKIEDGYQSVKKWTSKVDLFDKKYVIIPINENMHWYLAIIYLPEYVLMPP
ncbi:hypothetical protein HGRIS_001135 [Hohenbuehelia grisea]|uniref:Ubiquitin-like protease family profile domain-containing protein n=1 Tax=Hohenbuehelia grisea TaxID=104357 RepID=A0ABR3JNK4_9AGAR